MASLLVKSACEGGIFEKGNSLQSIYLFEGHEKGSSYFSVSVVLWPSGDFVSLDDLGSHFNTISLVEMCCTGIISTFKWWTVP